MSIDSRPSEEWCTSEFDFTAPELGQHLYETLEFMRRNCPVTYSDARGGYWVLTRYEDVVQVVGDWRTFSNASYATAGSPVPLLPITLDPPLHTSHRRLVNRYLTPAAVARFEDATRRRAISLIDEFIEAGECEFMEQFARPFPGLVFFHEVIHAPADEIVAINDMATAAGVPGHPKEADSWTGMLRWVEGFVEQRRHAPPKGDIVDAIIAGEVDGRPVSDRDICGTLILLIMGGLETTAGSLGHAFIRFADKPEISDLLRDQAELIPKAVEELLRLDVPFLVLQRTATRDVQVGGHKIKKGDRILAYLASANRDDAEFSCPNQFDTKRPRNRQIAFGVGPHRCVGSNLARMNLRVAFQELLRRLHGIRLQEGAEPIAFHNAFNRAPLSLPITFAAGKRETVC